MPGTVYITTPIYYVNDVPHIGHAYTTVAADVLARHYSQCGEDVFFLTGVDEHGQKVQQAAAKAGISPKEYCDRMVASFQRLWHRLNIANDAFIRTTDAPHQQFVQRQLDALYQADQIYPSDYTGWYCTFDERFWTEKDVSEGLCPDCKRPVERLSEKNYFFKMSRYQERLQQQIVSRVGSSDPYIGPESRANEVLGFLRKPLEDLSISRPKSRLSWGIELPFDRDYVTYVWFDALVNYLSALTYLVRTPSGELQAHALRHYWRTTLSGSTRHRVIHLVGKDILTTHAVYWSTMLMALGFELPTTIYAHGWWTVNGEKMSKSRGNVVDPNAVIDQYGVDAFRYFLLREVPFGQDGDFSERALVGRINSELADGLGNLMSRTLTMIERFCHGRMPAKHDPTEDVAGASDTVVEASHFIEQLQFSRALEVLWDSFQRCDQYLEKMAPWKLAKKAEDRPRLEHVLGNVAHHLAVLIRMVYPFMPETAIAMARQLGLDPRLEGKRLLYHEPVPGAEIVKGNNLFPRIEIDQDSKKPPLGPSHGKGARLVTDTPPSPSSIAPETAPPTGAPSAPQITIEDFQKIQLKSAKVLSAERVPRSDKLLKLHVDLGDEQRQIVAGIGKKYEPDQLVGKMIVIVANLKPAKLMGIESQGMVLAAGDKEVAGIVTFVDDVPIGTKVK